MIVLKDFIVSPPEWLVTDNQTQPWHIINNLESLITAELAALSTDYEINNGIAIHKSATIEHGAVLKGTMILSDGCFIGAHAYLRGPVYLGKEVKIGPGCEIKQAIILDYSSAAHFNYVGNSIIGSHVNIEAGAVCANHYNERKHKNIVVSYNNQVYDTQSEKFGALIGDHTKVGANAVLSPGTLLPKNYIVKRLELIEQASEQNL